MPASVNNPVTNRVTKAAFSQSDPAAPARDNRVPSSMPVKIFCAFSNWQPRAIWIRKELRMMGERRKEGRKEGRQAGRQTEAASSSSSSSAPPLSEDATTKVGPTATGRSPRRDVAIISWYHHRVVNPILFWLGFLPECHRFCFFGSPRF